MATSPKYIFNGDTTGNITGAWVQLQRAAAASIGFQIVLAATGSPIGLFVFEVTDDETPNATASVILGATPLVLVAPWSTTYQPTDGALRNVLIDFVPGTLNPPPSAQWMRMRYARTSGGNAGGFSVGVSQRGL